MPSFLGYTTQTVASASAAQVVTLTNSGAGALAISAITITGPNAADFAQTHACLATLVAAASCTFSVTFKPTATGNRQANLVLDNAGGIAGSTQTVTLFGVGQAATVPGGQSLASNHYLPSHEYGSNIRRPECNTH